MKSLRSIPRILAIHWVDGFRVSCLFNNGESRVIDFARFWQETCQIPPSHPAVELLQDHGKFAQVEVVGNSLAWESIGIDSQDENGAALFLPYQPDPLRLFECGVPDPDQAVQVGLMIRQSRKEIGLTQTELADKSGTSKHYISRLENNRADIELLTLKKIVEAGLGKKLHITIE
ncbi:MAG: helix-turn-helix domain-containing protein [Bacteroidota bacterium]